MVKEPETPPERIVKLSADLSDEPPRPEVKNRIKRLIYDALSRETGKQLPWGTLTGIRPVKISMSLLEEGKAENEIMDYMKKTYLISDEKADLAVRIAEREKAILETLHYENGYSLYIEFRSVHHLPVLLLYLLPPRLVEKEGGRVSERAGKGNRLRGGKPQRKGAGYRLHRRRDANHLRAAADEAAS